VGRESRGSAFEVIRAWNLLTNTCYEVTERPRDAAEKKGGGGGDDVRRSLAEDVAHGTHGAERDGGTGGGRGRQGCLFALSHLPGVGRLEACIGNKSHWSASLPAIHLHPHIIAL
jgi:hypothetical protein